MSANKMLGKLFNYSLICTPLLALPMSAKAIEAIEVPEPSVLAILAVGFVILGVVTRKK